ncbi:MAG: PqqD family protein [Planctomycetota bacterium]
MTPSQPMFRVNTELVACEVVDGEAVIINLSNGMYYTMDLVGAEVWQMIEHGCDLGEIASAVATRYGVAADSVGHDLKELSQMLLSEELIVEADADSVAPPDLPELSSGATYCKPALVSYADMNDVLALDPPLPELGVVDPAPARDANAPESGSESSEAGGCPSS